MKTIREKICCAFPGVGVKYSGKELRYIKDYPDIFRPLLIQASIICGDDLERLISDTATEQMRPFSAQCACYAISIGFFRLFQHRHQQPSLLAAYSFGLYPALVCAGSVDYATGLHIFNTAERLLHERCRKLDAGMAAIIGLQHQEVQGIIDDCGTPEVSLANSNNDTGHIISGPRSLLSRIIKKALDNDAISAEILPVPIAYHNAFLLAPVREPFTRYLASVPLEKAHTPILPSINDASCTSAAELRTSLIENLCGPINWYNTTKVLQRRGIKTVIECGPGISLTQNGRFSSFDISYFNSRNFRQVLV